MQLTEKKVFLNFIKNFYLTILIYIIAQIIGRYINIYTVTIVGTATNAIIDRDFYYLKENVVILIAVLVVSSILIPIISFKAAKLYAKVGVKFDTDSYSKLLRQKSILLSKYDKGELAYRIPEDEIGYRGGLLSLVGDGSVVLFVIFQSLYVMAKIHWKFAIICLAFSTIPILVLKYFDEKFKSLYNAEQEALGKISNCERTVIDNFAFIKTHILLDKVIEILKVNYLNHYNVYKKQTIITKIIDNFKEFFTTISQIFIYIIGSYYIASHQLNIGDCIKFFGLSFILKDNAKSLSLVLVNYFRFRASSKRYLEWTTNEEEFGVKKLDNIQPIIGENITFRYGENIVIDELSFIINQGDHVLIQGKNGSGKSTLLKLLMGLYLNYEGKIYINDYELRDLDINHLRDNISIVEQNPYLLNDSIIDNIRCCCKNSSDEKLNEILKELNLYHIKDQAAGENGSNLSGGQKQKISLARALIRNSQITVLDEPDNALDIETKEYIIDTLSKSKNTIIIISHSNEWEKKFSNKIIRL